MERSKIAVKDDKRIGALPGHCGISTLKLARVLYLQGLNLDSQNLGRSLSFSSIRPDLPLDLHGKGQTRERAWERSP